MKKNRLQTVILIFSIQFARLCFSEDIKPSNTEMTSSQSHRQPYATEILVQVKEDIGNLLHRLSLAVEDLSYSEPNQNHTTVDVKTSNHSILSISNSSSDDKNSIDMIYKSHLANLETGHKQRRNVSNIASKTEHTVCSIGNNNKTSTAIFPNINAKNTHSVVFFQREEPKLVLRLLHRLIHLLKMKIKPQTSQFEKTQVDKTENNHGRDLFEIQAHHQENQHETNNFEKHWVNFQRQAHLKKTNKKRRKPLKSSDNSDEPQEMTVAINSNSGKHHKKRMPRIKRRKY